MYVQDWGKAGDINKLKMHWHIPSEAELELVDRFLAEFLEPELVRLRAFMNGETLDRWSVCTVCWSYTPSVYVLSVVSFWFLH